MRMDVWHCTPWSRRTRAPSYPVVTRFLTSPATHSVYAGQNTFISCYEESGPNPKVPVTGVEGGLMGAMVGYVLGGCFGFKWFAEP